MKVSSGLNRRELRSEALPSAFSLIAAETGGSGGAEGDRRPRATASSPGTRTASRPGRSRWSCRCPSSWCMSIATASASPSPPARPASRAFHADRRVRGAAEGQEPPFLDLQRGADAEHEPADLVGHRAACRQPARLSGLAWLRAAAARFFGKTVRGDASRHACHHRRQPFRSVGTDASGHGARRATRKTSSRMSRLASAAKKQPADWTEAEANPVISVNASSADKKIELHRGFGRDRDGRPDDQGA